MTKQSPPDRWVVFRLGHLGDVALTTGPLARWGETRGLRFAYVTRASLSPLLRGHPAVDENEIVGLDESVLHGTAWIAEARRLAERFRGWGLLDLHGTLRSRILAHFWKGPVQRYPKHCLTRRIYRRTRSRRLGERLAATSVPQRYSLALESAPPPNRELLPVIRLDDAERETARRLLADRGLTGRLVALHPYATHPDKTWPREKWHNIMDQLTRVGYVPIIIGKDAEPLLPGSPSDLTGTTGLRGTCAILELAGVLVTGDSGPLHLASAVGTPVVALFGPTTRAWGFFPRGERDVVLERDLPCRPCSLHGAGGCARGRRCMTDIGEDEVLAAVERTMQS